MQYSREGHGLREERSSLFAGHNVRQYDIDIQHFEIQRCFTTRMAPNSPLAEELETKIKEKAPHIARCIGAAPPWDPAWAATAAGQLYQRLFQPAPPHQADVPRFTAG
jgi:hypothetical protein